MFEEEKSIKIPENALERLENKELKENIFNLYKNTGPKNVAKSFVKNFLAYPEIVKEMLNDNFKLEDRTLVVKEMYNLIYENQNNLFISFFREELKDCTKYRNKKIYIEI